jgi:hypothetical protein
MHNLSQKYQLLANSNVAQDVIDLLKFMQNEVCDIRQPIGNDTLDTIDGRKTTQFILQKAIDRLTLASKNRDNTGQ